MATDLNGKLFQAAFCLSEGQAFQPRAGRDCTFSCWKACLGFLKQSHHLLSGFFICFRLSLQTESKQSTSPCRDAGGYLVVAAASRERGRRWQAAEPRWRGGDCRRLPSFYLLSVCRRTRGWHARKGEPVTWHMAAGTANWACSSC